MKGKVAMAVRLYGQLASHERRVDELGIELNSIVSILSDEEMHEYVYHTTKIQDKENTKFEAFEKREESRRRVRKARK